MKKTRHNNGQSLDLVIFDCDGVLVDSEVISCRAHAETLTRHGYPITADQVLERFLGVSDREARLAIETETRPQAAGRFRSAGQASHAAILCRRSPGDPACRRGDRRDRPAQMRGLERHAGEDPPRPELRRPVMSGWRRTFSPPRRSRAASRRRTCSCSRPNRCRRIARAMPGDRGQRARRHRRAGCRDDRAGLSRRQPLPAGSRRHAACAAGAVMAFDDMRQLPDMIEANCGPRRQGD